MDKRAIYKAVKAAMFDVETVVMLQGHALRPEVRTALAEAVELLRPVRDSLEGELDFEP